MVEIKSLALTLAVVLAVGCGSDSEVSDSTADAPSPTEQAQELTDRFTEKYGTFLNALGDDRPFSAREDCPGMDQPLSQEERDTVVQFINLANDGTDPQVFVKDLTQLRADIVATGACEGLT